LSFYFSSSASTENFNLRVLPKLMSSTPSPSTAPPRRKSLHSLQECLLSHTNLCLPFQVKRLGWSAQVEIRRRNLVINFRNWPTHSQPGTQRQIELRPRSSSP
jgi:hypothetical protein